MSEEVKLEDIKQSISRIESVEKNRESLSQAGINVDEVIKYHKYKLKELVSLYFFYGQ